MRRSVLRGVLLWLVLATGTAFAEPSLMLTHSLTGTTQGADSTTLHVSMRVANTGDTPIYAVTLSYVPLLFPSFQDVYLEVGNLDAGAEVDLYFDIVTPLLPNDREFAAHPLFWAGECLDVGGNLMEFPAESRSDSAGGVP